VLQKNVSVLGLRPVARVRHEKGEEHRLAPSDRNALTQARDGQSGADIFSETEEEAESCEE